MLAKEVSFSASTLGTVEEINVRDRLEILCQTSIFIHLEMSHRHTAKSQIDLSRNNTCIQLRETNSSATKREYI